MIPWTLISILFILILLGILAFLLIRKKRRPIDYYSWFIIGIIWIPIGFAMGNYGLWILGIIFAVIGLANKDKWEKNRRSWNKMDKDEKKLMIIIMVLLGLLVAAGLVFFFITGI